MMALMECILVLLILTSFLLLGSSRLGACIKIAAFQGFLVALLPLASDGFDVDVRLALIVAIIVCFKGFIFPYILLKSLRDSGISREVQPYVSYTASIAIGVVTLAASFWLDTRLGFQTGILSQLVVPVSFLTMVTGLFLMISRKKAITQVLGYLVLENGIYIFGLAMVVGIPVLVEIGVLVDLFVAVFVMGAAIYHINREFDHIDSDQLNILKG